MHCSSLNGLPTLKQLWLLGNPISCLKDYRANVLLTLHTIVEDCSRTFEFDNQIVTHEERLSVIEKYAHNKSLFPEAKCVDERKMNDKNLLTKEDIKNNDDSDDLEEQMKIAHSEKSTINNSHKLHNDSDNNNKNGSDLNDPLTC